MFDPEIHVVVMMGPYGIQGHQSEHWWIFIHKKGIPPNKKTAEGLFYRSNWFGHAVTVGQKIAANKKLNFEIHTDVEIHNTNLDVPIIKTKIIK